MTGKKRHGFTLKELSFLKKNKDNMTYRQMAEKIGHTKLSIGKFFRENIGPKKKQND